MLLRRIAEDAEFRRELFLLVVDKLVIGLVVALTIAGYDMVKTWQGRNYDESWRQVDLTFRRAEYVKEFLPTILDSAQETSVRVESLRALTATGSITSESAMHFLNELLHDDVLAINRVQVTPYHRLNPQYQQTLTRTDYPGYEEEFFVQTVIDLVPDGLPALLGEHARVAADVETLKSAVGVMPDSPRVRMLGQIREFWVRAFDEILA